MADMVNLWLIVTGLSVLVEMEGEPGDPHMILLRRVPKKAMVGGGEIPPHEPRLRLLPSTVEIKIGDRDVEFVPPSNGSPTIVDVDPFIRVGRELTEAMEVDEDFLEYPRPDETLDGWSRVILSGGVHATITPIHVGEDFKVESISSNLRLKLVGAHDLESGATKEKHKSRVGNGLVYHRVIGQRPAVVFSDKVELNDWVPIEKSLAKNLPEIEKYPYPDYVAWISNAGMGGTWEDFDRDFYLLYELLDDDVLRYVPVMGKNWKDVVRNPPGQCMLGYALG